MVGILTTDGGPHPADKWAAETANQIVAMVQIDEASGSPAAVAARKAKPRLQLAIAEVMEDLHDNVMKYERAMLAEDGDDHLLTPLDPKGGQLDTVEEAVTEILALTEGTPFAAHFAANAAAVQSTVAHHFALIMDIERSWHADRNPDSQKVIAYREARAIRGAAMAHVFAAK